MPYTATLVSAVEDATPSVIKAIVEYRDGSKVVQREYRISEPQALRKIIQDQVNELMRQDQVAAYLAAPPLGPVDYNPKPPAPTLTDAQRSTLENARQRLTRLKDALDLGLITQTQYTNRLDNIKAALTAENINVLALLSS